MTDVAELGFSVDSSQVLTAVDALDKLTNQAAVTEKQVTKTTSEVTRGSNEMGGSLTAMANSFAGVKSEFTSATASAEAFQQALRQQDAFNELRMSLDGIYSNTKRYEMAVEQAQAAVASGAVSQAEANRVIDLAESRYLTAAGALDVYGHSARMSGAHTTNLMFQFQDIGMMLAAGQSPLMLAMQQGTQVAGVFQQMKNSGQGAFSGIIGGLRAMISPMSLLTIGTIAGVAALGQWAISAFNAEEAADGYKDALEALNAEMEQNEARLEMSRKGLDSVAQGRFSLEIKALQEELSRLDDQIANWGGRFAPALDSLKRQREEVQAAIIAAQERLKVSQDQTDEIEKAKAAGIDLSGVFDAMDLSHVIAQADTLTARLALAAQNAYAIGMAAANRIRFADDDAYQKGLDMQSYGQGQAAMRDRIASDYTLPAVRSGSPGGGGGGAARVSDEVLESQRAAARIMNDVERATQDAMSAAERYNLELEDVRELHEQGYLNAEQYARAVEMIDQEFQEASFETFRRGIDRISDSIADAIIMGDDLGESFGRVLQQMASDILSSGINDLLSGMLRPQGGGGGFLGSILGGLFGGARSFSGGGYTGDSPRTGGLDGEGGFPAILHPRETVIDHTSRSGGGGGAMTLNVNVSGARGNAEVEEMVQRGVRSGLAQYDRRLPERIANYERDPRARG